MNWGGNNRTQVENEVSKSRNRKELADISHSIILSVFILLNVIFGGRGDFFGLFHLDRVELDRVDLDRVELDR